jgi:hypothetical protein
MMPRICVTIDVSCGTGAVETEGLIGTFSVGVLPADGSGGEPPPLPKKDERKQKIKKGKDQSTGTKKAPAGTAYGSSSTSQGGTAEPTASAIKKTAEKAGAKNVTKKCNSDNSTCTVCFDADHFDWNFTGQFQGWVEIGELTLNPGTPPDNPKKTKGGGGGGGIKRNIYWPGAAGGLIDGGAESQDLDFLVIRCGMAPDPSVRTDVTLFFYGDRGAGNSGLRQLGVTMPNIALDAFRAIDRLEQAIRETGVAVFRVSGNAIAVPADARLLPTAAVCVSFRAEMKSFPGVACTGAWIAERETFAVSSRGESVPSVVPVEQGVLPERGESAEPEVESVVVETPPPAQMPLPGATIGILGADPRVLATAPRVNAGPALPQAVVPQPKGAVAPGLRHPDGAAGLEKAT